MLNPQSPHQTIERGIPGGSIIPLSALDHKERLTPLITSLLDSFARTHTLVIGDVILDRFIYGSADRISPEAPVLILHESRSEEALGGAGNVATNLASLSNIQGHAALIAITGKDPEDVTIRKLFGQHVGGGSYFTTDIYSSRPTTVKTRYVAKLHNTHLLRADRESTDPIATDMQDVILDIAEILLNLNKTIKYDSLILSDYAKGMLANGICQKLIQKARSRGRIVVVDPKGTDYEKYANATALTPNIKELKDLVGYNFDEDNEEEIAQAATNLMLWTESEAVLVTRSEKGVLIASQERSRSHGDLPGSEVVSFRTTYAVIPASARQVMDVSGAGDTAVAAFTLALAYGMSYYDAAVVAETAAGCAVAVRGTARVSAVTLAEALHRTFATALANIEASV
jgi:D-beta-D-heptose 7-phosphate kinase / D-beta-D-heptose 1-phosphate adenosyltransferase